MLFATVSASPLSTVSAPTVRLLSRVTTELTPVLPPSMSAMALVLSGMPPTHLAALLHTSVPPSQVEVTAAEGIGRRPGRMGSSGEVGVFPAGDNAVVPALVGVPTPVCSVSLAPAAVLLLSANAAALTRKDVPWPFAPPPAVVP